MRCECMIAGARASAHCGGKECDRCGWNPEEAARRDKQLRHNGLAEGADGLRYLRIRRIRRGGDGNADLAGQL